MLLLPLFTGGGGQRAAGKAMKKLAAECKQTNTQRREKEI